VDEIYLDIEPKIIGEGIPLFRGDNLDIGLELISEDKISDSEIQLHYRIVR
jgi:riboflavin biosynthesis pyrimidine reductase